MFSNKYIKETTELSKLYAAHVHKHERQILRICHITSVLHTTMALISNAISTNECSTQILLAIGLSVF